MDFKFGKEAGDSQQHDAQAEKKKQNSLLVLLLILVGGFVYLYFFTSLIKPQEAPKPAETVAASPSVVKMPLPTRDNKQDKTEEKVPAKADAAKDVKTDTVTPPAPVAKTAAAPANQPKPQTAKPAPTTPQTKPKEDPKKTAAVKPADKKPQPTPPIDKKPEKPAIAKTDDKKTPSTDKKIAVPNASTKKDVSEEKVVTGKSVKAVGPWTLVIGDYVLEETLSADMGRVRKAGLEPIVKPSLRKKSKMSRLFVSEYTERATAQSMFEKLKHHTSDAFIIEQGGKFVVYAGSYLQRDAAESEKTRLNTAGFSSSIKHADISIPSQRLSVGPFSNKKTADAALGKLKGTGLKASFSQK